MMPWLQGENMTSNEQTNGSNSGITRISSIHGSRRRRRRLGR